MTVTRPRTSLVLATALTLLSLLALPGSAQESAALQVDIRQAQFDDDGSTELIVSVTGDAVEGALAADAFTIREGETEVRDFTVTPLEETSSAPDRIVMLLMDVSGSTAGDPLQSAQAAARVFVGDVVDAGVRVGIVTFSDTAQLVVAPTEDVAALTAAIDALEAAGETAFFDAVLVAAQTLQSAGGQDERQIIAFTDGADTTSQATLQAAINAADAVDAPVSPVALTTGDLDLEPLETLATVTGGDVRQAGAAGELAGAFEDVAAALTSQYLITYRSLQATGEFALTVDVEVAGLVATDTVSLLSPRTGRAVGEPRVVEVSPSPVFGSRPLLYAALGALFLGLLVVLVILLVPTGDRRVARTLERGLRVYRRNDKEAPRDTASRVGNRAVSLVAAVPRPAGYDERLQAELDRASWPLRATELTALRVGAVLLGVLIGWGLLASPLMGVMLGVVGWVMPRLVLSQRISARRKKFLSQLPDTLQLLAGALKAGYGVLQAIDTIVKEVADPMSTEFQRVLTESRLGLPLEESLESMAERIDSDDFRWVVVAINIQRRVGGNLAELLETVSDTLREREMVRRQIDVLSAEGRLSAVILTLLPFGLAGYLSVVNPEYIGQLFSRTLGLILIGGAILLMGVGVVWMRRLIDIDV